MLAVGFDLIVTMVEMDPSFIPYRKAALYIKQKLEEANVSIPDVGIICGSGLSGLSEALEGETVTIKYGDIPGFPKHCTVVGHKGEVVFGMLSNVYTMCFRGRFHSYEGHDMKTVVLPVLVMRCLGVKMLLVTNAAGGINPSYNVGDVCCINDYIALPQLAGKNPLVGLNDDELGPRFPPTSNAFPDELRTVVAKAATDLKMDFVRTKGTCYCFVSGPMYESRAECKLLRTLGGDAVGMSTIPEVVTAHYSGMKVLGLSLITNKVVIDGTEGPAASHQEVLDAVEKRAVQMQELVKKIVASLKVDYIPKLSDLPPVTLDAVPIGPEKMFCKVKKLLKLTALVGIGSIVLAVASKRK